MGARHQGQGVDAVEEDASLCYKRRYHDNHHSSNVGTKGDSHQSPMIRVSASSGDKPA
jgi:hypothetical protein